VTSSHREEVMVFHFKAPRARLEGMLVGALERAESGGAIRVLEVVFVERDRGDGGVAAARIVGGSGELVAALTDLRLQGGHEQLDDDIPRTTREALAAELEAGEAIVAIRVDHRWAVALDDAVARTGGRPLVHEEPPPDAAPDLAELAVAAMRRATPV
jgi:hypothetical protein